MSWKGMTQAIQASALHGELGRDEDEELVQLIVNLSVGLFCMDGSLKSLQRGGK